MKYLKLSHIYHQIALLSGALILQLPYFFGGSRSFGLFRKGKIGIIAKFHRTDLVI